MEGYLCSMSSIWDSAQKFEISINLNIVNKNTIKQILLKLLLDFVSQREALLLQNQLSKLTITILITAMDESDYFYQNFESRAALSASSPWQWYRCPCTLWYTPQPGSWSSTGGQCRMVLVAWTCPWSGWQAGATRGVEMIEECLENRDNSRDLIGEFVIYTYNSFCLEE